MLESAVEVIGNVAATETGCVPIRREHQVIDEELAPSVEEFGEGLAAAGRIEDVAFFDLYPGKSTTLGGESVTFAAEPFLLFQQRLAGRQPFFVRNDWVLFHRSGMAHSILLSDGNKRCRTSMNLISARTRRASRACRRRQAGLCRRGHDGEAGPW